MKKIIFLLVMEYVIYAGGTYRRMLNDCNQMYIQYKLQYTLASNSRSTDRLCSQLGIVDRRSFMIEDPQDEIDYLEYQKKTLGLACEQIRRGTLVSYKNDYCIYVMTSNIQPLTKKASEDQKFIAEQYYNKAQAAKVIDPSIQYKNTPQLELNELHIYGINTMSVFKNKKDMILIESSTGRFAIPVQEVRDAKRINFTAELTQKLDALLY